MFVIAPGYRGTGVQECRGTGVQGYRVQGAGVKGCRGTGVQGYRGTGVQAYRGAGVQGTGLQGCRGKRVQDAPGYRGCCDDTHNTDPFIFFCLFGNTPGYFCDHCYCQSRCKTLKKLQHSQLSLTPDCMPGLTNHITPQLHLKIRSLFQFGQLTGAALQDQ